MASRFFFCRPLSPASRSAPGTGDRKLGVDLDIAPDDASAQGRRYGAAALE
jgi:hypothetical protein